MEQTPVDSKKVLLSSLNTRAQQWILNYVYKKEDLLFKIIFDKKYRPDTL